MIVDASVAVKWLLSEEGSEAADAILAAGGLGTPDLIFAEVANVLWKGWKRGDFVHMPEGLGTLAACFERVTRCADLMATAATLAIALDHPAYDCFYLAMALGSDDILVTADARFIRVCAASPYAARVRML